MERLDGGVSHGSLNAMSNVGLALDAAGRLDEARATFERELEERTKLLGPSHVSHIPTHINLGMAAEHAQDLDEARRHWERADQLIVELHGKEHPDRAHIRTDLAWLDMYAGDISSARDRFEWSVRLLEKSVGPTAEATVLAKIGLASARLRSGEHAEACPPLAELERSARDTLGEGRAVARLLRVRGECAGEGR